MIYSFEQKLRNYYFSTKFYKTFKDRNIYISITIIFLVIIVSIIEFNCNTVKKAKYPATKKSLYKKIVPQNLSYFEIVPEVKFENLTMLGVVKKTGVHGQRLYGMILRTLRFQNITKKVEKKYGLPNNILLAMIMQESGGVDLLPNSGDDGGLGLCHMQATTAKEFGLKVIDNCNKLVCRKHGKELRKLIIKHKYNKKKLIGYDDRFHPIMNIDAAGRMLKYYSLGKQYKDTPIKTAIYRYAGRYNYEKYYKSVEYYMKKINNKKLIKAVEKAFNEKNDKLLINGKKSGFKDYIKAHQNQNLNYGLKKYR